MYVHIKSKRKERILVRENRPAHNTKANPSRKNMDRPFRLVGRTLTQIYSLADNNSRRNSQKSLWNNGSYRRA